MSSGEKEGTRTSLLAYGMTRIPNPDYADHPAYGQLYGKPKLATRIKALKKLLPYLKLEAALEIRELWRTRSLPSANSHESSPLLQSLVNDGAVAVHLTPDEMARISQEVSEPIKLLEARRSQIARGKRVFEDNLLPISKEEAPALHAFLGQVLNEHGVMPTASRYLGAPVNIKAVVLQIVDADDTHWRLNFSDINQPDPATSYMHVDSSPRRLKCILYLNHIDENNGPFCYVVGSNNLKVGLIERIIRKANDKSRLDKCDPPSRELFWALPKMLQKKAEFGNDLFDATPQAAALIACEHKFSSEDGNLILFSNDGIHRGGMVVEGKRLILQIQLEPKSGATKD